MALSVSGKKTGASGIGVSLQGQILEHFLDSMSEVRDGLVGKYEKDLKKRRQNFLLSILYIRKLVPDRKVQEEIKKAIDAAKVKYKDDGIYNDEDLIEYAAQLETITEVMAYLNRGMDLIHNDTTGSLTKRARKQATEPDRVSTMSGAKGIVQSIEGNIAKVLLEDGNTIEVSVGS